MDAGDLLAAGHVEHVALAEQLLGALLAEDGARIDLGGDREADPGRQIGLDDAGDDVDRGALGRHDQVDAGRARLLGEALDQELDLLAGGHHQIGELVDDDHDLRQDLVFQLLHLVARLAGLGIVAGLHPAPELGALRLGLAHLGVEAGQLAHAEAGHHPVALLHLLDGPFERADRLGRLGDDRREQMRDVLVDAEFEHLRDRSGSFCTVRAQPVEQRQDHAVEADRLARAGGAGDEQMRHRRQIGDDRIAGDILAQDQRQGQTWSSKAGLPISSDKATISRLALGSSMPITLRPGDGRDARRQAPTCCGRCRRRAG